MTPSSDRQPGPTPVIRWLLFLVLGGLLGMLVPQLIATAHACSCRMFSPESRDYTITSITQLEGSGDREASEWERWTGDLTLSASEVSDAVELYLYREVSDQQVRHVRIAAESPSSDTNTGDVR